MSPEAENIFEMPPHLFFFRRGVGGLPILGQTQNGRQAERLFFFFFFPRQLERVILGVIGGDKALIQLGQVAPRPPTPSAPWWQLVPGCVRRGCLFVLERPGRGD